MKSKIIKSILFSTIGTLSVSAVTPMVLSSCGKKQTIPVQSVELDKKTLSLTLGDSYKLTANVLPENATNKKITWKSNDESVATVDQSGNITAESAGNATITIVTEDGGYAYSCTVQVNPPVVVGMDYGTWGNIKVIYKLLSNHECRLLTKSVDGQNGYVEGAGVLRIPDHVVWNSQRYYVKRIPSNWSNGENDINGIEFESNVSHLEEICDFAFTDTNAIQNYKLKTLTFPEGLARIGLQAFYNTDLSSNINMTNVVFPTSFTWIGEQAFAHAGRFIEAMTFKGNFNPGNIGDYAFSPYMGKNAVEYIYAPTIEIATNIANHIRECYPDDFEIGDEYLIPRVIGS